MASKPEPPQALRAANGSDATFDTWLFRLWSYVTTTLNGLFPSGLGRIFYSDGAGGIDSEAAFTYTEATNTLQVENITGTTGTWTGLVKGLTLQSTVATGTAPLVVASTTVVANLNADLLDGQSGAYYLDSANFTGTSWVDLTDAGATTLHKHDHGGQDGLADDDHAQYALLVGRSGGQTLLGGTASGDDLTLNSTSNATKGDVFVQSAGGNVIIGGGATASRLRLLEASGSGANYTEFVTQPQVGDITYTLPADDGDADDVLSTNGSGTLSWVAQGAGSDATPMTPQGRLTLTTATAVMTAEAANQTTIYYTPYVGDIVPLYGGASWTNTTFAELSIAMAASANWAANSNFDVFVFNDAGTIRLVTGAAWTNATTRAEAIARLNGIWTNSGSITGRYGASSTVTVAANRGTYVGTFRTTGSAGTTTWELGGNAAGGDPGLLYVWNCYSRVPVSVGVGDSTDSWTYGTADWRSYNNSTSNRISFVRGLNEDSVKALLASLTFTNTVNGRVGVALDAVNTFTGQAAYVQTDATITQMGQANYCGIPGLGLHFLQGVEYGNGVLSVTFYGDLGSPTTYQNGLHFYGMF